MRGGQVVPRRRREGGQIPVDTVAGLGAIWGGLVDGAQTGDGLGGANFSWTAALTLDLLRRPTA